MNCLSYIYLAIVVGLVNIVKTEYIYSCTQNKTIALTFDDGPFNYTRQLVDYFVDKHPDVKVTFFEVAHFHYPHAFDTPEYQEAMKKAHDNGLQLASHTYNHKISDNIDEFKKSLKDMDDFIEKVTGDRPHFFRAPKGHCDEKCQAVLDEGGYRLIQWDVDTKDWDLETSGSAEQRINDSIEILKKKFAEEKDNYLILMHDTEDYTVSDIAPWIIEKSGMKEKGYRFVTVAECLGEKEYMYVSGKTYGNTETNNNSTIINNKEEDGQQLKSGVLLSSKPIYNLTYLFFGLLSIFIVLY